MASQISLVSLDDCQDSNNLTFEKFAAGFGRSSDKADFLTADTYISTYKKAACTAKANKLSVALKTIGKSAQGKPLMALELGCECEHQSNEPILYMGGQHAREWVAHGVCFGSMIHAVNQSANPNCRCRIFSCMTNPDGYTISRNRNRMQRRSSTGVDLNRNWKINMNDGTACSRNRNHETYRGPRPFSEKETQALSNYYLSVKKKCGVFGAAFDIHGDMNNGTLLMVHGDKDLNREERAFQLSIGSVFPKVATSRFKNFKPLIESKYCGAADEWMFENLTNRRGWVGTAEMPEPRAGRFKGPASMVSPLAQDFGRFNDHLCDSTKYATLGKSTQPLVKLTTTAPPTSVASPNSTAPNSSTDSLNPGGSSAETSGDFSWLTPLLVGGIVGGAILLLGSLALLFLCCKYQKKKKTSTPTKEPTRKCKRRRRKR